MYKSKNIQNVFSQSNSHLNTQFLGNVASGAKKFTQECYISAVCGQCDKSTTVEVKVKDVTAPSLVKAEIADYKTVVLTFDEDIADPANDEDVVVKTLLGDNEIDNKAAIALEGTKAIKVTYENSLAAGEYTFTVSGVKDKADTPNSIAAEKPASVTVTKEASVLDSVDFVTTILPSGYQINSSSGLEEAISDPKTDYKGAITLKGKDQYGEELANLTGPEVKDVTITAVDGARPLFIGKASNVSGYTEDGKVANGTIADTVYIDITDIPNLKTGDSVTVSVNRKGVDKPIAQKNYTLVTHEAKKAAAISKINVTEGISSSGTAVTDGKLTSGQQYTLTPEWLDQYGNPLSSSEVSNLSSTAIATWAVTPSDKVEVTENGTKQVTGAIGSIVIKPQFDTAEGTVTVKAFYSANDYAEMELNVSAPELKSIDGGDFANIQSDIVKGGYNKESFTSKTGTEAIKVGSDSTGAILTPDMLKAKVTGKDKDNNDIPVAELPTVTFDYEKDNDGNRKEVSGVPTNNIIATVKSERTGYGKYDITYYVGDDAEKATVKKTITNVIIKDNPVAESLEMEKIGNTELTQGGSVTKTLTFKNKHDDVIDLYADDLDFKADDDTNITAEYLDKDGVKICNAGESNSTTPVAAIKIKANASTTATSHTITLTSGTFGTGTITVNVAKAATLASATLKATSSQLNPIKDDHFVESTGTSLTVKQDSTDNLVYTLIPVDFEDSYGNHPDALQTANTESNHKISVVGTDNVKIAVEDAGTTYKLYDAAGKEIDASDYTTPIKYIGIHANASAVKGKISLEADLTNDNQSNPTAVSTLTISPRTARTIKSIESITADDGDTTVANNAVDFTVKAVDNYGREIDTDDFAQVTAVTGSDNATWIASGSSKDQFKVTPVDGTKAGDYSVNVKVNTAGSSKGYVDLTSGKELTQTVTVHVKDVNSVDSVKFNGVLTGSDNSTYTIPDSKLVYINGSTNYTLGVDSFVGDTAVKGSAADLYITPEISLKDKDGKEKDATTAKLSVDPSNGKVELKAEASNTLADGDQISITLTSAGLKASATLNLVVSTASSKITSDITVVNDITTADVATGLKESIVKTGVNGLTKDADGAYNNTKLVIQGLDQYGKVVSASLVAKSENPEIADIDSSGNILVKKAGVATINVLLPGDKVATPITVTITDDDVKYGTVSVKSTAGTNEVNAVLTFSQALAKDGSNLKAGQFKVDDGNAIETSSVTLNATNTKTTFAHGVSGDGNEHTIAYSGLKSADEKIVFAPGSVKVIIPSA